MKNNLVKYAVKVFNQFMFHQKTVSRTTWGVLDPSVGNTRLNVVRLVASLLQTNTHIINQELINLNMLGIVLVSRTHTHVHKETVLHLKAAFEV